MYVLLKLRSLSKFPNKGFKNTLILLGIKEWDHFVTDSAFFCTKKKRATWSETNLRKAVLAVQKGKLSTYKAAEKYGVPRRTLRSHVESGDIIKKKLGRKALFTEEQEINFNNRLRQLIDLGLPLTPKIVRNECFDFCREFNIPNNFNKTLGLAGLGWYRVFIGKNPDLAELLSAHRT